MQNKKTLSLTKTLLNHSLDLKKGDILMIRGEDIFEDFYNAIKAEAEKKKAEVIVDPFNIDDLKRMIENADGLAKESQRIRKLLRRSTALIEVYSLSNPLFLSDTDPHKIAAYQRKIVDMIIAYKLKQSMNGYRWNIVELPTQGCAFLAEMSPDSYEKFLFKSTNRKWTAESSKMKEIKELFDSAKEVRIVVEGQTDIRLSLEGRKGFIEDGKINMPGGEIFYGPLENSINGYITFNQPILRDGKIINELVMFFHKGKLLAYKASENMDFVKEMVGIKGAKRIGEFGIGCNYNIKRFTKNLSFDEKIGGTIHFALGRSYTQGLDQGGGLNRSRIHWDLVCDLRKGRKNPGGKIYIDGRLVQENGRWVKEADKK